LSDLPTIIHVDDGRGWRGGQYQVQLLMEGLARRGVSQRLIAQPGSPLARAVSGARLPVIETPMRGEWDWVAARRIAARAAETRAGLMHAHTAHAHGLARWARRRLRRSGSPRLTLVVTRRVDFPVGGGFISRRKYADPGQFFIAISEAVAEVLKAGGVAPERVEVVHSGVPPFQPGELIDRAEARRALGIDPTATAIVAVGALVDHKGHRWLIEAAPRVRRRFPTAEFWILGEGELRPDLERRIAASGLNGVVHLSGHVPAARRKLAAFDLYVSSSHLEGMGTSILDAMLAGIPVVAAAAGGVTEVVIQGVTGRLAPPADPAALADQILAALTEPEEPRRHLIAEARRHAETRFSAEAMVEGTLAVYRRLWGERMGR